MRPGMTCAAVLLLSAILSSAVAEEPGWQTLLDATKLADWNRVTETNWRVEDGVVMADKRIDKDAAYLVGRQSYKDFLLQVEVWVSDDANSGILFRCANPAKPGDSTCYEVNLYDQRSDASYGTGAIVRFAEVDPMPKAGNKWSLVEISAKGRDLVVTLNGQVTAKVRSGFFLEGPIALQYGRGTVKFKSVRIKPL